MVGGDNTNSVFMAVTLVSAVIWLGASLLIMIRLSLVFPLCVGQHQNSGFQAEILNPKKSIGRALVLTKNNVLRLFVLFLLTIGPVFVGV